MSYTTVLNKQSCGGHIAWGKLYYFLIWHDHSICTHYHHHHVIHHAISLYMPVWFCKPSPNFEGNLPDKWLCTGDCRPSNRFKPFQETHAISLAKFEWKTACKHGFTHKSFTCTFILCHSYCVSFLERFGPIAGAMIPIRNHFYGKLARGSTLFQPVHTKPIWRPVQNVDGTYNCMGWDYTSTR